MYRIVKNLGKHLLLVRMPHLGTLRQPDERDVYYGQFTASPRGEEAACSHIGSTDYASNARVFRGDLMRTPFSDRFVPRRGRCATFRHRRLR